MIKIENLRKVFDGSVVALDNLDMIIEDKCFVALLGPSGCGKTTTLNALAGLLEPTSGSIHFNGVDVTYKAPKDRNIGMVFQSYALYPHLKVIDNIAFPLKQKGVSKQERHMQATEMAKKLQIEYLLDRKPTQLSGGQQQRVAMARALVKQPDILLLDEPMSNLDARLKIEIREVIKKIQRELQVTSVIVTHDQEEAMAIADKIAILDNGKIQQFDTPEELFRRPVNLFVANFMGNPPMNFISGEYNASTQTISNNEFDVKISDALCGKIKNNVDQSVVIGIRAHEITLSLNEVVNSIRFKIGMIENLGKELLISGNINEDLIRITMENSGQGEYETFLNKMEKDEYVYLMFDDIFNIFNKETKMNITI